MTVRRAEVARWVRDARADGGKPGENSDLAEALDEHALLERRIAELEYGLAAARIVEPAADGSADIGIRVRLRTPSGRVVVYEFVGALDADPTQRRLSLASPVGQALLGRVAGEVIEVEAPSGSRRFEILAIDSSAQPAAA